MQKDHERYYRDILGIKDKKAPLSETLIRLHHSATAFYANLGAKMPWQTGPMLAIMAGYRVGVQAPPQEPTSLPEQDELENIEPESVEPEEDLMVTGTKRPGPDAYEINDRGESVLTVPKATKPKTKAKSKPKVNAKLAQRCSFMYYGNPKKCTIESRTKKTLSVVFSHEGKEKSKKIKLTDVIEFIGNGSA